MASFRYTTDENAAANDDADDQRFLFINTMAGTEKLQR